MAYTKTNWLDRAVEFVRRYTDQNGNQYTFTPDEGTIYEVGTPVNALNMLKQEQGIFEAFNGVSNFDGNPSYLTGTFTLGFTIPNTSLNVGHLFGFVAQDLAETDVSVVIDSLTSMEL